MKEVIVFTSESCGPCRSLKPFMQSEAERRGFPMRIIELNNITKDHFAKYEVRSVPTVVFHDGEQELGRFIGAMTNSAVESKLAEWGL